MKLVDLCIVGGHTYIKGGVIEACVAIDDGKIVKVAKEPNIPQAEEKIDARGLLVLPGLIDVHVHLRGQKLSAKEDFTTGTEAAASGGFCTVLDMPNNMPPTTSLQALKERMSVAEREVIVNVGFYVGFPEDFYEASSMARLGAFGFKINLFKPIGSLNIDDDEEVLKALNVAYESNIPVAVHAEDRRFIEQIEGRLKEANRRDVQAFLEAHSHEAEERAVLRMLKLIKLMENPPKIHFCHVTTRGSLNAISMAKRSNPNVTCEATPHHLLLTSAELKHWGAYSLMVPPLREEMDLTSLFKAVVDGRIDILASDHAPHTLKDKEVEDIWEASPGIPGLETTLPLMLTQIHYNRISLKRLVELLAENPAKIFNITGKGYIGEGYDADITIIDLKKQHTINPLNFKSKAKYSPFNGWRVKGALATTIINGKKVIEEGSVITKAGHILKHKI